MNKKYPKLNSELLRTRKKNRLIQISNLTRMKTLNTQKPQQVNFCLFNFSEPMKLDGEPMYFNNQPIPDNVQILY